MRMTLNQRTVLTFVIGMLLLSIILLFMQRHYEYHLQEERMDNQLSVYCDIIARDSQIVKNFPDTAIRITIFDSNFNVLYDNKTDSSMFYNHKKMPEFKHLANGEGSAFRKSRSSGHYHFYYVKKHGDKYIRTSRSFNTKNEFLAANGHSAFVIVFFFIASTLIFLWSSRRYGITLNKLKNFIQNVDNDKGKMDFPDNEFKQIGQQISKLYHNLSMSQKSFATEREKLLSHLKISKRGLAIFSPQRKEILSNDLFIQYINLVSDKRLQFSEDVFDLPQFSEVVEYLDDKQRYAHDFVGTKIFYITKNEYTLLVTCILFNDKSFEINIEDVTKQQEQEILKKQLTQNISHELKTPVSSIQGFMEILMEDPDMDPQKRKFYIQRCYSQAVRLSYLLRDISMLTKLDESSELFDRSPVKIRDLIENVLQDVALELEKKKFKVRVKVSEKVCINGNNSLLYSIFRNLVDNSLHYAGTDITITINCYRSDNEFYYFSYSDDGIGVDDKHLSRIFERFYRVDKGRSRKLGGTGLGLAIVKNAVAMHGGRITAKKHAGGGLEFLFTFKKDLPEQK